MGAVGRVLSVLVLAIVLFALFLRGWEELIFATGGALYECEQSDCGTLGELNYRAGSAIRVVGFFASVAVAWLVVHYSEMALRHAIATISGRVRPVAQDVGLRRSGRFMRRR